MIRYPDEVKRYIYEHYKGCGAKDMAKKVSEKFNLPVTSSMMKSFYGNHKLNSGVTGHFPKGHVPANKGKKIEEYMTPEAIEKSSKTRFKEGGKPKNTDPIGAVKEFKDGYLWVKIDNKPKAKKRVNWMPLHEFMYVFWNGPVPEGKLVFFRNGNKRDFGRDNLGLITRGELAIMNHENRICEDAELTEANLYVVKLKRARRDREKGKNADTK